MRTFSDEETRKLKTLINEGVQIQEELTTLKEGLSDTVKAAAEEMDLKPALINKAIRVAYKAELQKQREAMDDLETILETAGRNY
jgi:hypothetical protein